MAQLKIGTTIGGFTVYHEGNINIPENFAQIERAPDTYAGEPFPSNSIISIKDNMLYQVVNWPWTEHVNDIGESLFVVGGSPFPFTELTPPEEQTYKRIPITLDSISSETYSLTFTATFPSLGSEYSEGYQLIAKIYAERMGEADTFEGLEGGEPYTTGPLDFYQQVGELQVLDAVGIDAARTETYDIDLSEAVSLSYNGNGILFHIVVGIAPTSTGEIDEQNSFKLYGTDYAPYLVYIAPRFYTIEDGVNDDQFGIVEYLTTAPEVVLPEPDGNTWSVGVNPTSIALHGMDFTVVGSAVYNDLGENSQVIIPDNAFPFFKLRDRAVTKLLSTHEADQGDYSGWAGQGLRPFTDIVRSRGQLYFAVDEGWQLTPDYWAFPDDYWPLDITRGWYVSANALLYWLTNADEWYRGIYRRPVIDVGSVTSNAGEGTVDLEFAVQIQPYEEYLNDTGEIWAKVFVDEVEIDSVLVDSDPLIGALTGTAILEGIPDSNAARIEIGLSSDSGVSWDYSPTVVFACVNSTGSSGEGEVADPYAANVADIFLDHLINEGYVQPLVLNSPPPPANDSVQFTTQNETIDLVVNKSREYFHIKGPTVDISEAYTVNVGIEMGVDPLTGAYREPAFGDTITLVFEYDAAMQETTYSMSSTYTSMPTTIMEITNKAVQSLVLDNPQHSEYPIISGGGSVGSRWYLTMNRAPEVSGTLVTGTGHVIVNMEYVPFIEKYVATSVNAWPPLDVVE